MPDLEMKGIKGNTRESKIASKSARSNAVPIRNKTSSLDDMQHYRKPNDDGSIGTG